MGLTVRERNFNRKTSKKQLLLAVKRLPGLSNLTMHVSWSSPTAGAQGVVFTSTTTFLASHADILLARHALLPNERLLKRAAVSFPFVYKDQLEITCMFKLTRLLLCDHCVIQGLYSLAFKNNNPALALNSPSTDFCCL